MYTWVAGTTNPNDFTNAMISFARANNARLGALGLKAVNIDGSLSTMSPPNKPVGIIQIPDSDFLYQYVIAFPNTTNYGIVFSRSSGTPSNLQYQIWYNSTLSSIRSSDGTLTDTYASNILSVMRGVDEALMPFLTGSSNVTLDVTLVDWPVIATDAYNNQIVAQFGSTFYFCSLVFVFMSVINQIMAEKENKLRLSMEMMGMKNFAYWLSWLLTHTMMSIINSLSTWIVGRIFSFGIFVNSDFPILLAAIVTFILGLLFQSIVFSEVYIGYIWWDKKVGIPAIRYIFYILPFFHFGKILMDVGQIAAGTFDPVTETVNNAKHFSMKDLFKSIPSNLIPVYSDAPPVIPPPSEAMMYLLIQAAGYFLLAWYLDNVLPDAFGNRSSPFFFLEPSFYGIHVGSRHRAMNRLKKMKQVVPPADEDLDVTRERDVVMNFNRDYAIRIINLKRIYAASWYKSSSLDKVAVNNISLAIENGKLLALLGQNGAGKSTLNNILAGAVPCTSGDAFIFNLSVRYEMHKIREYMGVCPQFDVLFNDLTAKEHLELYSGLKGINISAIRKTMMMRLDAVKLLKVADKCVKTFSGGMKRRLSLIISTIGDPKVIFMDEPTTGMDPLNRRHVWSFIEQFKKDRVIILTTHSMEEADVLGDRIAIMAHGRLRGLGTSIHLKSKFGTGYRISLVISSRNTMKVKDIVANKVPSAILEDDSAGSLIYQFPSDSIHLIPRFVDYLERNPDKLIKAWGISHSTLEEVFLRLIREANPGGYNGYDVSKPAPAAMK